jgi:hypothetical protein
MKQILHALRLTNATYYEIWQPGELAVSDYQLTNDKKRHWTLKVCLYFIHAYKQVKYRLPFVSFPSVWNAECNDKTNPNQSYLRQLGAIHQ